MPRPRLAFLPTLCLLAGTVLAADALFLFSLRVFSLGATLPLALGCGFLLLGLRWQQVQRWAGASPGRRRLWRGAWAAFWLWLLTVLVFFTVLARLPSAAVPSREAPQAILVLGSGTPGGKVSPLLAARLDAAYARAQRHPAAVVVTSGGIGRNEVRSEAAIMGDALRAKGLDPRRIVQEEASTSTQENLAFSRALLATRGIAHQRIELVTSDFHTWRARAIALRAGYADVRTIGAPTPFYVRYNAWLREYFALGSSLLLGET